MAGKSGDCRAQTFHSSHGSELWQELVPRGNVTRLCIGLRCQGPTHRRGTSPPAVSVAEPGFTTSQGAPPGPAACLPHAGASSAHAHACLLEQVGSSHGGQHRAPWDPRWVTGLSAPGAGQPRGDRAGRGGEEVTVCVAPCLCLPRGIQRDRHGNIWPSLRGA